MVRKLLDEIIHLFNLMFRHTPNQILTDNQLDGLHANGLFHATTKEAADSIAVDGLKPSTKKPLFRREKNMVWLYPNNPTKNSEYIKQILNKGKRKNSTHVVLFSGLDSETIEKLRSRVWDDAIIHDGLLKMDASHVQVLSIDEFLKKS
jgi:hypothetical protein